NGGRLCSNVEPALDLPNILEIMIEAVTVDRRQVCLKSVDLALDRIEYAAPQNSSALAFRRRASRAEHAIENDARADLHRQGRVTIRPRDTVHVSAGITPAAGPF